MQKKPVNLCKTRIGLALTQWVLDELDAIPGSRRAKIEAAILGYYEITPPPEIADLITKWG